MLHTLNLHNDIGQSYLNKAGSKKIEYMNEAGKEPRTSLFNTNVLP